LEPVLLDKRMKATFRNIGTKERLVDRVVNEIQAEIVGGRLSPDTLIPPERELCEQLGVSRTVLREAVRMLVSRGLLETRPGVGTIVRQVTTDHISQPLSLMINQSGPINLDHLNQVRQILEVAIARQAALEATEEDVQELVGIYTQMASAVNAPPLFNQLDSDFHQALAEITHNPLLVLLLDTIRDTTQLVRKLVSNYEDLSRIVLPDHELILKHILGKNPAKAGKAMQAHLEHARSIQKIVLNGKDRDVASDAGIS